MDNVVQNPLDKVLGGKTKEILAILSPKEIKILEMRHGLTGSNNTHTLESIGRELGVTRQRVQQIEVAMYEKIRSCFDLIKEGKHSRLKNRK